MRTAINLFLSLLVITAPLWGQFKHQVPRNTLPAGGRAPSRVYSGLLDPSRFHLQQGFSMSLMNVGNQVLSVGAYTNLMTFQLQDNLRLQTRFSLIQPSGLGQHLLGGGFHYGATLEYQPTRNSSLHFSFDKYPAYRYQPAYLSYPGPP